MMTITEKTFQVLKENFITLDELAHLYCSAVRSPISLDLPVSSIHKLKVLGLIDEMGVTTFRGEQILGEALAEVPLQKIEYTKEFEEFWKKYPISNGERKLKNNKQEVFLEFQKAATSIPAEQLIQCLERAIIFYTNSPSKFKFVPNAINWLRKREFESYMENTKIESRYGEEII